MGDRPVGGMQERSDGRQERRRLWGGEDGEEEMVGWVLDSFYQVPPVIAIRYLYFHLILNSLKKKNSVQERLYELVTNVGGRS